ncbi:MAG: ABC transporter permease [Bryobacterales bacterium]|nr:ABC transporter permease [Bryobacterales bacterium]
MFWRVLRTEALKLKRTVALRIAVLTPLVVVLLMLFLVSQMPLTTLRRRGMENEWVALARFSFFFWGLLMLPLYITLEASLIAGIDHAGGQWKGLLARPVPRHAFYLAKLAAIVVLTLLSTAILVTGVIVSGLVLPHLQQTESFGAPVPALPIIKQGFQMTALGLLALAIQNWVSLRWHSFAVSTGVGVVAMVLGYGMAAASQPNGGWTQWFPWSLPMLAVASWPVPVPTVIVFTSLAAIVVTIAGCVEFSAREVN